MREQTEGMRRMREAGVAPVVVIEDAARAVETAQALLAGGIGVMEVTLRTAAGLESIRRIAKECPAIFVGAGTVLSVAQCEQSLEAGARFIVSPGYSQGIVDLCRKRGVDVLPGCVTPTEIMRGLDAGLSVFKFFPANVYGGRKALSALAAPFGGVRFVPTGGVNGENLEEYLSTPCVQAVGGSWLCAKGDIAAGDFARITALSAQASQIVKKVRAEEK